MDVCSFRFKNSIKIAIACVVATIAINAMDIPLGVFSVIAIFVLFSLFYEESLKKGLERFLGALIFSLLGIVCVNIFYNLPLIYFIAIAGVSSMLFYQFAIHRWGIPYAMLLGALSFILMMTIGMQSIDQLFSLAWGWILGNGLGVFLCGLFNVIWPLQSREDLNVALASHLQQTKILLNDPVALEKHIKACQKFQVHLNYAKADFPTAFRSYYESHYLKLIFFLKILLTQMHGFMWQMSSLTLKKQVLFFLLERFSWIGERIIDQLSFSLEKKQPLPILSYELERLLEELYVVVHRGRAHAEFKSVDDREILKEFSAIQTVEEMVKTLLILKEQLASIFSEPPERVASENNHPVFSIQKTFNTLAFKQSVKMTLGVVLVLFLSLWFGWPGAIQAMIAVVVMMAQPNLGKAHLRFSLRFLGVLVGGLVGLLGVILMSHYTHFWFLLLYVCITMGVCAYISMGSERISYFGIQAGVMIPLILLFDNALTINFSVAIQRFVGVMEGAVVAGIILYLLWPVHPLEELKRQIVASLRSDEQFVKGLMRMDFPSLRMKLGSLLQVDEQLIIDARYILFSSDYRDESLSKIVTLLNRFAFGSGHLLDHLEKLALIRQKRLLSLFQPVLVQLARQLEWFYTSLEKNTVLGVLPRRPSFLLEKLLRRLRRLQVTRQLDDASLISVMAVVAEIEKWVELSESTIALAQEWVEGQARSRIEEKSGETITA